MDAIDSSPTTFAGLRIARRHEFSHRFLALPKAYPDSQLLLERRGMSREAIEAGSFWQINLYSSEFFGLPDELFWEPEINWHRQRLGVKGLIGAAGLWLSGSTAIVTILQSDLCQQLYRHDRLKRSCKTDVERRFARWYVLLFNAVLDFCLGRGITVLHSPTGEQVLKTVPKRVAPELFMRIYDSPHRRYRCSQMSMDGAEYWQISLQDNKDRIVRLASVGAPDVPVTPRICLFHDVEENIDTPIAAEQCEENLRRILEIENALDVHGTFDVVGTMFKRKRDTILAADTRHSLAFHTFDHDLEDQAQLRRYRAIDLRVRGYRPAQSRITAELTDANLRFCNFEWLASSSGSLGHTSVGLEGGLVKIPVHLDDYPLFRGAMDYPQWEARVLRLASRFPVLGLGLHDCYAEHWLSHYPQLLEKLRSVGPFASADEVCDRTLLAASHAAIYDKSHDSAPEVATWAVARSDESSAATIVIPLLRQVDEWLEQCVTSGLTQSAPTEVIVVHSDQTPPSNLAVLERLKSKHDRLSFLVERKPGSFPNAINTGFQASRTERVGLLLSDDWLDRDAVAECLARAADIVSTGAVIYFPDLRINEAACHNPNMARYNSLRTLEQKAIYLKHFFLFRREIAVRVGLDESIGNYPGIDDYDFIWTLLEHDATVDIVERRLYHYRDHDGERMTLKSAEERTQNLVKILKKHGISDQEAEPIIERHQRWFGRPIYKVMGLG